MLAAIATASGMDPAARAESAPAWSDEGTPVRIVQVLDGETLRTADGAEVRLVGLGTAKPAALRPNDGSLAALQRAARDSLMAVSEGRGAHLHFERLRQDRHGRLVAHVVTEDGIWLQAHLAEAGLARIETSADTAARAAALLRLEARAREAGRGLWGHAAFRVIAPHEAGRRLGTFQLIEGTLKAIEGKRPSRFVLVGGDHALTIAPTAAVRSEWRQRGDDLSSFMDRPARIRGWLRWQDGAVVDVTHAAQIEWLDEPR